MTMRLVRLLLGVVMMFTSACTLAPDQVAPPARAVPDRNAERAAAVKDVVNLDFRADAGGFRETYPADGSAYATLWPLSQTVVGLQTADRLAGSPTSGTPALTAFDPYWDTTASPPGYL